MKRFIMLMLTLIIAFSTLCVFSGCGDDNQSTPPHEIDDSLED